jgi:hypothetical protein
MADLLGYRLQGVPSCFGLCSRSHDVHDAPFDAASDLQGCQRILRHEPPFLCVCMYVCTYECLQLNVESLPSILEGKH